MQHQLAFSVCSVKAQFRRTTEHTAVFPELPQALYRGSIAFNRSLPEGHIFFDPNFRLVREILRQKLADATRFRLPEFTPREAVLPAIPKKIQAIIGMRRAGKTFYLFQCIQQKLNEGVAREGLVYLNLEDERLAGIEATHLSWLLEEFYLRTPGWRDQRRACFLLDEVQVVPGWEVFLRRILDSEQIDLFVSGSSARLLSREISTALRGRAMETTIFPFNFKEFLSHNGKMPPADPTFLAKSEVSVLENAFSDYLQVGGFPEAQGVPARDRLSLIQGYVDVVVLRDVMERHQVHNLPALRALVRQLLGGAASRFSVHKFYNDLKSQGVRVSKDSVHQMLTHLDDAFLILPFSLWTSSERQRQSNPRKVYPIDPGLAVAFDRSGKANRGHLLETVVAIDLVRRGWEAGYLTTPEGYEVNFCARDPLGGLWLIQVADELESPEVRLREVRALDSARAMFADAQTLLLTGNNQDSLLPQAELDKVMRMPVWRWLLR